MLAQDLILFVIGLTPAALIPLVLAWFGAEKFSQLICGLIIVTGGYAFYIEYSAHVSPMMHFFQPLGAGAAAGAVVAALFISEHLA